MALKTTIRAAVRTAVIASGAVDSRCYIGRYDALPTNKLPAACVYGANEVLQPDTHAAQNTGRSIFRDLEITIEVYEDKSAAKSLDQLLDEHTEAIMEEIGDDSTLGDIVDDAYVSGVRYTVDPETGRPTGVAVMTVRVVYGTVEGG